MMEYGYNNERQERIEAYVRGTLSEEALVAFEAELRTDPRLQEDVATERVLLETLQRAREMRFRDLVERVSGEQERSADGGVEAETPVIPISRGRWMWLAAAASVALAVTFAVQHWSGSGGLPADALAELNTGTGFEFSGVRGGAPDEVDDRLNALRRTGKLDAYLLESEQALQNDTAFANRYHDPVRLDRAIVWLRLNKPDKALDELAKLRDPARWDKCEAAEVRGLAAAMRNDKDAMRAEFQMADRAGCLPDDLRALMN